MKYIHIVILLFLCPLASCYRHAVPSSKIINQESLDARGNMMLLGKSTRERLEEEPFAGWFNKNYTDYKVDSSVSDMLKRQLKGKKFIIFMGTWCGDSQQEVPRIFKLLDYCDVPSSSIQLINVHFHDSLYKQSPDHEEHGLGIHRVPDLLVYDNKKEIGRIIEKPVISWEKDLLSIVRGEHYQPNYKTVAYLQSVFRDSSAKQLENNLGKLADSLRPLITKNEGLPSFANVLLATKDTSKALIVLRLNTILYETNANGFIALGDVYMKTGDLIKAKRNYEQALKVQPGHEKALTMLAQLMEK
jgi:tetratricopeptide (TPR) repeat protein